MKHRSAVARPGMSVVGSSGWYAALGVLSTPPARSRARLGPFDLRSRWRDADARGERVRHPSHEEVAERGPVEAFAAAPDQFDKTRGGRLRIGEGMVRSAVHHPQLAAQTLESDRVLQVEELRRKPCGVDVVGIEAGSD